MAVPTVMLLFLSLLPTQVLLDHLLSDRPAMAIAGVAIDRERQARAQRKHIESAIGCPRIRPI